MKYYFSLVGPLVGIYFPLPATLKSEGECRMAIHTSRLKNLWMSIYDEAEVDRQIAKYGGLKLPDEYAEKLDYDSFLVSRVAAPSQPPEDNPGGL